MFWVRFGVVLIQFFLGTFIFGAQSAQAMFKPPLLMWIVGYERNGVSTLVSISSWDSINKKITKELLNMHGSRAVKSMLTFPSHRGFLLLMENGEVYLFRAGHLPLKVLDRVASIAEGQGDRLLAIRTDNEIRQIDEVGGNDVFIPRTWLPIGFGPLVSAQRIGVNEYAFAGQDMLVTFDLSLANTFQKAPTTIDIQTPVTQYLNASQEFLQSIDSVRVGMGNGWGVAWILATKVNLQGQPGKVLFSFDLISRKIESMTFVPQDSQLFEVEPYSCLLTMRSNRDLLRLSSAGGRVLDRLVGYFSNTALEQLGWTRTADLLIDYPAVVSGVGTRAIAMNTKLPKITVPLLDGTLKSERSKSRNPMLDPSTPEEFRLFIRKWLNEPPATITSREFVRRWQQSGPFVYFFADLTDSEMKTLGIKRYPTVIDVLPGYEAHTIYVSDLIHLVVEADARRSKKNKCEATLK